MSKPTTEDLNGMEGPGVARRKIKPLEDAIDAWNSVKEKRMALTEKEAEAKAAVRLLMEKNEVAIYRYGEGDHEVVLVENVKNRKVETNGETED